MAEQRGKFIVFEGIDGAGKTTQIERLAQTLRAQGRRVMVTAEPTVSVTGGLLRDALGGVSHRSAGEMAALFVLDRIFHNVNPVNGIEKMLADGVDVICDRYYYSSLAYQGSETDFDWVAGMNLNCPGCRHIHGKALAEAQPVNQPCQQTAHNAAQYGKGQNSQQNRRNLDAAHFFGVGNRRHRDEHADNAVIGRVGIGQTADDIG